ncbi:MAG: IclR family transcriptional regulator [Oscillospiraceae bacterium]|nr:IclR family transcriptional regulator [Oscillospiraceae bacterium]
MHKDENEGIRNPRGDEQPRENESRYILSSVDNALSILNLFFDHEELSVSEVGKLTGMSRSTAFRFMLTLESRGFVTKTDFGKYRLGLNMFSLGMLAYNRMELVSIVHPWLVEMAAASGETCHVAILSDGVHVTFIDRALSNSWLKMDTALGYSQVAHCTATGKCILAYQPEHVLTQYLRRTSFVHNTPSSIPDARTLLEVLEKVRREGYACDNEEAEAGLTCYGMPLLDSAGHAYAAISISGPTTRMEAHREEHLQRIRSAVKGISQTIL